MSWERDYSNDYEGWLKRDDPSNPFGGAFPEPIQTPEVGETPDASGTAWLYDPNATPPYQVPGQEWYWNGNQWTTRGTSTPPPTTATVEPPTTYEPTTTNNQYDFGDGGGEPAPFNWSQFNPTPFSYADYVPKFGPFSAPSMQDAENEPGFAFARDQGRKTLENSAAGRGVLRTGGTLKDILEYGNKFGEQNYNGVFNRKYQTWQGNNAWDRDNYNTNRETAFGVYDRNYRGQKDSFDATRRGEELTFTDQYNRWRDRLNSLTQISTAGAP